MNIYKYDIWDGDKGIIIAKTENEAWKLFNETYQKWEGDDLSEHEQIDIDYIGEVPKHPTLFFVEG